MSRTTRRRPLILVVEDEQELLEVVARHLDQHGFEVVRASTIAEARAVVWERQPDLLLLDVLLPDGSGYDLCAELRKSMAAPIIFVTALAQDRAIVRGLGAGGDDYIAKPFSLDVLLARVNAQLRRHGLSQAMRIDLPPLHLDFVTGKVILHDEEVDLSKREMQLLAYLAANTGQGFTQEELLERVWDDHSGLPTNTVRQHVSTLRRKLSLDEASAFELVLTPDRRYVFQQVRFDTAPGLQPVGPS
ncbi:MAG TPA: response regulator transcription factor [Propionicimonas sp.]